MTEERLKELIPDIDSFIMSNFVGDFRVCLNQCVKKQTEKLRAAITCMIYVDEETGNRDLSDTVSGILGISYSEILLKEAKE